MVPMQYDKYEKKDIFCVYAQRYRVITCLRTEGKYDRYEKIFITDSGNADYNRYLRIDSTCVCR